MSLAASITSQNNSLVVAGELNFATVVGLWNQSLSLLAQSAQLHFDFQKVESCNSAGVALMLEWIKYAKSHHKTILFSHIPQQLNSIIAVSGIDALLKTA